MRIKRIIEYLYDKQTNEKTRHILYREQKKAGAVGLLYKSFIICI